MAVRTGWTLLVASLIAVPLIAQAKVVGNVVPAPPLTAARIANLPAAERGAWEAYLARSTAQAAANKAAVAAEARGGPILDPLPEVSAGAATMPLDKPAAWYATPEARHIADVIVSFQTPGGGWTKNQKRDGALRQPGQAYNTHFVSTLDNGATITEMRFLAVAAAQAPGADGGPYRQSFLRGVDYLLAAQYPNGGWPQIWPLEGDYHDAVTFNDDALIGAVRLLDEIAAGKAPFDFVPVDQRARARAASAHALEMILASQVTIDGRKTVWAQQHDTLTLKPVGARNYEPDALSAAESANILLYLMSLQSPSPAVVASVQAGMAWLEANKLAGKAWLNSLDPQVGRALIDRPGSVVWARYYDLSSGQPVFGDRDLSLHDDVREISLERRSGYAWYGTGPQKALDAYAVWSRAHP